MKRRAIKACNRVACYSGPNGRRAKQPVRIGQHPPEHYTCGDGTVLVLRSIERDDEPTTCALCELEWELCECCDECGEPPRNCDCEKAPLTAGDMNDMRCDAAYHEGR